MCPGYRGIRSRWLIGRLLEYQKYNNCINTSYTLRREWFVMHWYNCQRREKLLSFNFPNLNIPMRLTQQRFFCWWHRLIFIISLILTMFSVVCSNHSFSIKRLKLFLILIKFWLYLFGIQEPKNNERICRMLWIACFCDLSKCHSSHMCDGHGLFFNGPSTTTDWEIQQTLAIMHVPSGHW